MKIATFNINNVNKRLANLLGWLRQARPDVACLQELKATGSKINDAFENEQAPALATAVRGGFQALSGPPAISGQEGPEIRH
jgi:exonuclease III